jgi:hypothetical protein
VCKALKALSLVHQLNDFTAEIEFESKVRKVFFKGANDNHIEVTYLLAQFDCTISDINLLKDMATNTKNTTYVQMIHDELNKRNPNFQSACLAIHQLQRMVNVSNKVEEKKVKELTRSNVGTSNNKEKAGAKCSHCQGSQSSRKL